MKTLEDEQYVVIKAYTSTVFEIWRDFNVLSYIACPRYPYIGVYRLYDRDLPQSFQVPGSIDNTTHTQLLRPPMPSRPGTRQIIKAHLLNF